MVRDQQVVVRFSAAELAVVRERAELAGLAMGAWIGQVAADACEGVGLVDLLRLHADVVALAASGAPAAEVARLLERIDEAVDAVVAAVGQRR